MIRTSGKTIEGAIADLPDALATLKLHYLRWVLFDIGQDTYFMYQGIFDTDFDKYTEDAVPVHQDGNDRSLKTSKDFRKTRRRIQRIVKFVREHQCPSFLEYGEYPYVTAKKSRRRSSSRPHLATCST